MDHLSLGINKTYLGKIMNNLKISAIIFDLDGTLVDSCLNFNLMRKEIGIPNDAPILEYVESSHDPEFKKFAYEVINNHEVNGAKVATAIRDIEEFMSFLSQNNIPRAILTRNSKHVTDLTLQKFEWDFHKVLTRDCAPAKPRPDAIFKIARELNLDLKTTLYIGDHGFDIETAQNANCISGLIKHDYNTHLEDNADFSITNFKELLPYIELEILS